MVGGPRLWPLALVAASGCGRLGFDGADARPDVATPTDSYGQLVLGAHPLAYWRLDDTDAIARDSAGSHDGMYVGGCGHGAPGAIAGNAATTFDGASCRVEMGDSFDFAGMQPFSIELWVQLSFVDGSVRWCVSHASRTPKSGYAISFLPDHLWFEQFANDSSLSYVSTSALPSLAAFHHVVATTNATRQRIYIDGALASEVMFAVTEPTDTGPFVLGDYLVEDPNKLAGTLDEVAIYDLELDAATIAAHYAAR